MRIFWKNSRSNSQKKILLEEYPKKLPKNVLKLSVKISDKNTGGIIEETLQFFFWVIVGGFPEGILGKTPADIC